MVGDVLHADDRGEVEERVKVAPQQRAVLREVAVAHFEPAGVARGERLEVSEAALLAGVDGRDGVALLEQLPHELEADHASAAGDEVSHRECSLRASARPRARSRRGRRP